MDEVSAGSDRSLSSKVAYCARSNLASFNVCMDLRMYLLVLPNAAGAESKAVSTELLCCSSSYVHTAGSLQCCSS